MAAGRVMARRATGGRHGTRGWALVWLGTKREADAGGGGERGRGLAAGVSAGRNVTGPGAGRDRRGGAAAVGVRGVPDEPAGVRDRGDADELRAGGRCLGGGGGQAVSARDRPVLEGPGQPDGAAAVRAADGAVFVRGA